MATFYTEVNLALTRLINLYTRKWHYGLEKLIVIRDIVCLWTWDILLMRWIILCYFLYYNDCCALFLDPWRWLNFLRTMAQLLPILGTYFLVIISSRCLVWLFVPMLVIHMLISAVSLSRSSLTCSWCSVYFFAKSTVFLAYLAFWIILVICLVNVRPCSTSMSRYFACDVHRIICSLNFWVPTSWYFIFCSRSYFSFSYLKVDCPYEGLWIIRFHDFVH